jgi:phosphoribosyl 1,2-cyclic phosphodiesterase
VHTIPTPHDAEGSVAFVVEAEGVKVGVLTDLGHPFPRLLDAFGELDGAFLESNYDPDMLEHGPYPRFLKDRIAGPGGHLSNEECAEIVAAAAKPDLRFVVLSHLSGNCNTPEHALARTSDSVPRGPVIHLAPRDDASPRVTLEA